MKPYAERFYKSKAWERTRKAYASYRKGLCERCYAKGLFVPGVIVHHKCHITPENITDPMVTLSFDNLELLCRNCHAEVHSSKEGSRFVLDDEGRVIFSSPPC